MQALADRVTHLEAQLAKAKKAAPTAAKAKKAAPTAAKATVKTAAKTAAPRKTR
jgi:hypothetical protein